MSPTGSDDTVKLISKLSPNEEIAKDECPSKSRITTLEVRMIVCPGQAAAGAKVIVAPSANTGEPPTNATRTARSSIEIVFKLANDSIT
jgi:hypothetical protein